MVMIIFGNRTLCHPIQSVIIFVMKQTPATRPSDFVNHSTYGMITNRIELHSVLLPLFASGYNPISYMYLCMVLIILHCIHSPLDIPQCCGQLLRLINSVTERLLSNKITGSHARLLSVLSQAVQSYSLLVSSGDQLAKHLDYKFILTLIR